MQAGNRSEAQKLVFQKLKSLKPNIFETETKLKLKRAHRGRWTDRSDTAKAMGLKHPQPFFLIGKGHKRNPFFFAEKEAPKLPP